MATLSGVLMANGLPRDDVTVYLYPASSFVSPPELDTALPATGLVDTATTGPEHGCTGAYRFADVSDGTYYIGADWNGSILWDSFDIGTGANPLGYYDAVQYGVPDDGVTDAETAITALIATIVAAVGTAGNATIYWPKGNYFLDITAEIVVPPNISFLCEDGAVFTKALNTSSARLFAFLGADTATTTTLSSNGAVDDTTVSVTSATGFAAGDYVRISDTTFHITGSLGRNEELNRIVSISGTTITLRSPLINAYATASTARMTKTNPYRGTVQGGEYVVPVGGNGGCLRWELAMDCRAIGVTCRGADVNPCQEIKRCRAFRLESSTALNGQSQGTSGHGYGCSIVESCYDITVDNHRAVDVRENAVGAYCREIKIVNSTCDDCSNSGWNTHHQGADGVTFANNQITGGGYGIIIGGSSATAQVDRNILIQGNRVRRTQHDGISASTDSGIGTSENLTITGNVVEDCGLDGLSRPGILVARFESVLINSNRVNGKSNALQRYGIQLVTVTGSIIAGNRIENLNGAAGQNGGIFWSSSCDSLQIFGNSFDNIANNNLFSTAPSSTNVLIGPNQMDDAGTSLDVQPWMHGNQLGALSTPFQWYVDGVGKILDISTAGVTTIGPANTGQFGVGRVSSLQYTGEFLGTANSNTSGSIRVANTLATTPTSVRAGITMETTDASGFLGCHPSGYTAVSALADRVALGANSDAAGIVLSANNGGQDIRMLLGGSNLQFTFASALMTLADAVNIAVNTTTGTKIGTATNQKLGFYNATPVVQIAGTTQTFATADGTHAARTATTLTDSTGGTANTTLQALTDPADAPASADALRDDLVANLIPQLRNNYADLAASNNAIIADLADTASFLNFIVDGLQSLGLFA